MNDARTDKIIWLSHILNADTPAYGGTKAFELNPVKQLNCGDSCNSVSLKFSNHVGSHVDAPYHFIAEGLKIEDYLAEDWVFAKPLLIEVPLDSAELISMQHMSLTDPDKEVDLIFFRTGFEHYRQEARYWQSAPGFAPELAEYLRQNFPSLKAIGMDTISLTSYQHRDVGREAHRAFLGLNIRLFEDLALAALPAHAKLQQVIALPLRFSGADGAPCTVMAWI